VSNRDSFVLKLMKTKGMSLEEAEAFVEDLDIPEAPTGPAARPINQGAWNAGDAVMVRSAHGEGERAVSARFSVASKGQDGLDAVQAQAVAQGRTLCPNCQHPEDDHLPGCSRIPGMGSDAKARTKGALPAAT
jgi:hypothetical protein